MLVVKRECVMTVTSAVVCYQFPQVLSSDPVGAAACSLRDEQYFVPSEVINYTSKVISAGKKINLRAFTYT